MKSFDNLIGAAARVAMRDDRRIRSMISRIVPEAALEHVIFCRHADRQLHVTLDSAAWIPKLRFCERKVLAALIRDGLATRSVNWHVAPAKEPVGREPARRHARTASAQAERAVLSVADAVDSPQGDDILALQLRRMANHLRGR